MRIDIYLFAIALNPIICYLKMALDEEEFGVSSAPETAAMPEKLEENTENRSKEEMASAAEPATAEPAAAEPAMPELRKAMNTRGLETSVFKPELVSRLEVSAR